MITGNGVEKMREQYRPVIGLEIHVALDTESKMFCACVNAFGSTPNTDVCPVCLGLPGSLPVTNARAIELGITCARALGGQVAPRTYFERKHYHYPDLPKGYQISQYAAPLSIGGELVVDDSHSGEEVRVRIRRVHLEEDAGKSMHSRQSGHTQLDFNRCGVPLAEIVTEPDITSCAQARRFLEELRAIMRTAGVSRVRMEEGELRCDVNFNLVHVKAGQEITRTQISEIKNLNSFRAVQRALEYELMRHRSALEAGDGLLHETRHWDADREVTYAARTKEQAHDYRYFPDPDLPPILIERELVDYLAAGIPELPRARRRRLRETWGIEWSQAEILVEEPEMADFFESAIAEGAEPSEACKWIVGEIAGYLNTVDTTLGALPFSAADLAALLRLVEDGAISGKIAKEVWLEVMEGGGSPEAIVERRGLRQISDDAILEQIIEEVVAEHPEAAEDYAGGKDKTLGFLVGQVMQKTRGQANPQKVNEMIARRLRGGRDDN